MRILDLSLTTVLYFFNQETTERRLMHEKA